MIAQQRSAEQHRAGAQARLASEVSAGQRNSRHSNSPWVTGFTLHAHHIAKLDRFVGQAQRAALRAERQFEGVSIEVNAQGLVSVHATGVASILL
jgi:hypothetical protein